MRPFILKDEMAHFRGTTLLDREKRGPLIARNGAARRPIS